MRNRKGIAPLVVLVSIVLAMGVIYLVLYIPIPAFKNLRATINYFLLILFWFVFQAIIIFAYLKLGELSIKGVKFIKSKVLKWNLSLERYIVFKT